LRYTDLLTSRPENVEADDLDELNAFFSEEQIIELAMTVATANWTALINDGLQTPLE
jgi:alkylhydroperoxidase family enzyme